MGEAISDAFEAAWADAEGSESSDTAGDDAVSGMYGADVAYGDEIDSTDEDDAGDSEIEGTDDNEDSTAEGDNAQVFDWKQFSDQKVAVKVGGEEVVIPLAEALNGYMRQADYTRKTQAHAEEVKLAGWAQQLREAIQADPAGTIEFLQKQYGVTPQVAGDVVDDEFVDPEIKSIRDLVARQEQEMRSLHSVVQQFEADRILNEVRDEMKRVQGEFPDLDPNVVLPLAAERGLSIRDAYLLNESSRIIESRKQAETAATEAAKVAERQAAKRQNLGRTSKSTGIAGTSKVQRPQFDTFAEMLKWELDHAESAA